MNTKLNSPLAQMLKEPNAVVIVKQGELVNAKFIGRNKRAYYFDLDRKGTGIVYGVELLNAQDSIKDIKEGDVVLTKVVEADNEDGYVELSLAETNKQKVWQEIKTLKEQGDIINVKVLSANTGGLITEINGIKAFLPVSQLATDHYPKVADGDPGKILGELKKLVDQELKVKVIDFNPRNNKLIISEREMADVNIKEKLSKYKAGDVVSGIVSGIADFGIFIKFADDPNIEGLIHISELDHKLIENPRELVKVNDIINAQIIEIKDNRVSLSIKALKPNPWEKVEDKYSEGQVVSGVVSRLNPFGAVINLDENFQGLIKVSDFGSLEEMKNKLETGKGYNFLIESIKPQEKRIILKLKI